MRLFSCCFVLLCFFYTAKAEDDALTQAIIKEDIREVIHILGTSDTVIRTQRDSKYGFMPLTLALLQENNAIAKVLIDKGINIYDKESIDAFKFILTDEAIQSQQDSALRFPTFFIAALLGNNEIIKYLYSKHKSALFEKDKDGNTILSWAAYQGHVSTVQLLLSYGLDSTIKNKNGLSAFEFANSKNHYDIAKLFVVELIKMGAGSKELSRIFFESMKYKDYYLLELLINKGATLEVEMNGLTPFLFAAKEGDIMMLRFLEKKGANVYAKKATKSIEADALSLAIQSGNNEVAEYLLDNFDFNLKQKFNGQSYLDFAIDMNNRLDIKVFEKLLSKGEFDLRAKGLDGNTLLHKAVFFGYDEYVKFLSLEESKLYSVKNNKGLTAMQMAQKLYYVYKDDYIFDKSESNSKLLKKSERIIELLYSASLNLEE